MRWFVSSIGPAYAYIQHALKVSFTELFMNSSATVLKANTPLFLN
jgi:hypothetical protein